MTDHALKQLPNRRKPSVDAKRKKRIFLVALLLVLGIGAFLLQREKFYALSEILTWLGQHQPGEITVTTPISTPRGDIYDRNFRRLAATYDTYAIYARPLEIENPAAAAELLEKILGVEPSKLLANLKSERGFVWIAKGIEPVLADSVTAHNIKGIYQVIETKRFYPNKETAAHAVGFVENGQGLDGIEYQYNTLLRGGEINSAELETLHLDSAPDRGQSGFHLVLTLDLMLQTKIERFLEKRVRATGAASGGVLLMDANTGSILAMASYPAFNPNKYWEYSSSTLKNHAVTEPVYPGELALIFQQAAAFNLKNERRSQALETPGAGEPLRIIEPETLKRRNISTAPQVDIVDPEYLARFARMLGFGKKPLTDIPLKDETPVSTSFAFSDPAFHASALRLLTAFTALVNNGRIVPPHLLYQAYPRENPAPIEPSLSGAEPDGSLHPATSKDLMDFLTARWLQANSSSMGASTPMFFEAHRFAAASENSAHVMAEKNASTDNGQTSRIEQSVMLGAIPGRDPKMTIIGLLSYDDSTDTLTPETLQSFGKRLSVLSPDQDMIQKMLYVADQPPLVPAPDFWTNNESALAANPDPMAPGEKVPGDLAANRKHMPDVTGKSLRAGLQTLQHYNLDIRIVGSGRIVSQKPAAGVELGDNTVCILKMRQEI